MDLAARKTRAEQLRGREVRRSPLVSFEMRDAGDGTSSIEGCFSVTERGYDMGWYEETIAADAFDGTLARNPDVQLLINHEGLPLARTVGGTLKLWRADQGPMFAATVQNDDPDVQRLVPKARARLIDQCSFAFSGAKSEWDEDMTQRRITSLDIHRGDVSVVNQGANPFTSFSMRSFFDQLVGMTDTEEVELRESMTPDRYQAVLAALQRVAPTANETEPPAPQPARDLDLYRARAFALRARG